MTKLIFEQTSYYETRVGGEFDGVTRNRYQFTLTLNEGDQNIICSITMQVLGGDIKWVNDPSDLSWRREFPIKMVENHFSNFKSKFARDKEYREGFLVIKAGPPSGSFHTG